MSSSIDSLDVSSSLSCSGFLSILGGIVSKTYGMKGSIYSLASYWLTFSPSMRVFKMSVFLALASRGIG